MSVHIGADKADIADIVLLPGDPYRARWAAEKFLTAPKLVNEVRGMLGYTGMFQGRPVTIHGSGMGMPSLSIYTNELINEYGAKTLIRIGSCGGMAPQVAVRDIVLAMTASYLSSVNKPVFGDVTFAPCADWSLLRAAADIAGDKAGKTHVGGIISQDLFYQYGDDRTDVLIDHQVLAVEMEAAALYTLAAKYDVRALAVLTVSDHLKTGESLPSSERETSFGDMVDIALQAACAVS